MRALFCFCSQISSSGMSASWASVETDETRAGASVGLPFAGTVLLPSIVILVAILD